MVEGMMQSEIGEREKTVIQKNSRNPDVSCINIKGKQLKIDTFSYLGSVITRNEKTQNEINERKKKVSQFYHLVKRLLKKNINKKCKPYIFNVYFKIILEHRAVTCTTT